MFDALKEQDKLQFIELFAGNISLTVGDFEQNVDELYEFIQGELESYEIDVSICTEEEYECGTEIVLVSAPFTIKTSTNKYYVALKECVKNDNARNNIGVLSVYIVDEKEWENDYTYWGGGVWNPGINIEHY